MCMYSYVYMWVGTYICNNAKNCIPEMLNKILKILMACLLFFDLRVQWKSSAYNYIDIGTRKILLKSFVQYIRLRQIDLIPSIDPHSLKI